MAIITRSFGIPAVINVPGISTLVHADSTIIIDGYEGKIIINPSAKEIASYKRKKNGFAKKEAPAVQHQRRTMTRDGIRVRLEANANSPEEVYDAVREGAEGIGLMRSEFFYMGRSSLPEPGEELNYYKRIHEAAGGRPVTIRLLDLGADKTLPYAKVPPEINPQLGLRGIRYLFANKELLCNHLKNVLLSSKYGTLKVLVPFVSIVQEIDYLEDLIAV